MRAAHILCIVLSASLIGGTVAAETAGEPGTNVDMPFLIAPMTLDGKLTGYAYVSSKVVTISQSAALEVRAKIPFIQDAFVRDVNTTSIGKPTDPKTVDSKALVVRLLADVRRIIGAAKVVNVVLVRIQMSALHPNQALLASPPPE